MTYLSHREYRLLTRAEAQAKENLGLQTGGPYEAEYRVFLEDLRKVVLKIKHGGNEKPVKAKRREPDTSELEDLASLSGHPSGLSGEHDVVLDAIQECCLGGSSK